MTQVIPRSRSRKVNGYVKAILALEAVRRKRDARYERFVRVLDQKRDRLEAEVETRRKALTGGQQGEARWIVGAIPTVNAFKDRWLSYQVSGRTVRIEALPVRRPALTRALTTTTVSMAAEGSPR
jgi:hypothetical protein